MRLTLACLLLLPSPLQAAEIAAHRATYALEVSMEGVGTLARGAYEIDIDTTCDAWVMNDEMAASGAGIRFAYRGSSLEAVDGARYDFDSLLASTGADPVPSAGRAEREDAGFMTRFEKPADAEDVTLPAGTLFPVAYTRAIIDAALAGEARFAAPVFVGDAQVPLQEAVAHIRPAGDVPLDADGADVLSDLTFWTIETAYYDSTTADAPPMTVQTAVGAENGAFVSLEMVAGPLIFTAKARAFDWYGDPGC